MRRLFLALSIVVLVGMQTAAPMYPILLGCGVLFLKTDKRGRIFIVVMLGIVLLRMNLDFKGKAFTQGYVTEINASSYIVENGLDHILVYTEDASKIHPFDRVAIVGQIDPIEGRTGDFGFDALRWASANRILGTISEDQTLRFCRDSLGHFLLAGGFAQNNTAFVNVFRDLIYDTQPDDPLIDFVSLGLQFALLLGVLNRLTQAIPNEILAESLKFVGLFLFGWLFGYPLTALRFLLFFLTSRFFTDRKLAFCVNIMVFMLYDPNTLSQWTVLIPLAFQFSSIFFSKTNAYFVRCALLAAIFMRSNGILLPISILFFPLARSILILISAVFWSATIIPILAYPALWLHGLFINLQSMFDYDLIRIIGTIGHLLLIFTFILFMLIPRNKALHWVMIGLLFASPCFIYLNPFPQVVFLNAGQGDTILVRSAFASCTIVMDTGPPKEASNILATLRSKSVIKIDALILTHPDADHSGNQALFGEQFDITEVVASKKDVKCKGLLMKSLDPLITFGDVNADSLIYATSLNQTRFLFMADGDVNTEAKLLERYDLTSDIVKLGHHGSQSASSDEFIGNLQAKLAIISVGKNSYGHPHASVLARLKAFRQDYLTTRREGDITLTLLPGFAFVTSTRQPLRIVATGH